MRSMCLGAVVATQRGVARRSSKEKVHDMTATDGRKKVGSSQLWSFVGPDSGILQAQVVISVSERNNQLICLEREEHLLQTSSPSSDVTHLTSSSIPSLPALQQEMSSIIPYPRPQNPPPLPHTGPSHIEPVPHHRPVDKRPSIPRRPPRPHALPHPPSLVHDTSQHARLHRILKRYGRRAELVPQHARLTIHLA